MKPLFITIKRDGRMVLAINSQDIKVVTVDNKNKVTVFMSNDSVDMPMTQYAVDKLRKEIRDRYNVVKVSSAGIRRDSSKEKNDIIEVTNDDGMAIIFPKALHSVEANDNQVTVLAHGERTFAVETTSAPKLDDLNLLNCALEAA